MIYAKIKRLLDISISLCGLLTLLPLFIFVSVAIKMESDGPIIFKQERLGLHGQVFKIYKFRSMCVGAEKEGSGQYSFAGDPRVTKVGKFLRASSIDEFPQFINILKGEMSIIGPRPVLTYHPWTLSEYAEEQLKRFSVRPGVTGLAQINGRKGLQWAQRIEYDIEYVDNLSFTLDLKILVKTVFKVLTMRDNVNTRLTSKKSRGGMSEGM